MVEEWNTTELARSSEWLNRLARGLVGDRADAEDVVQDSWLAFLQGSGARARSMRPFLVGIVRRMSSVHRRGRERRLARERAAARPEALPSARDVAERLELQRRLVETLLTLNDAHRRALYLRYYEGLDAPEIAAREGVNPAAVRKRIERALAELRTRLDTRDDHEGSDWRRALVPWIGGTSDAPDGGSSRASDAAIGWGVGLTAAAVLLAVTWTLAGARGNELARVAPLEPDGSTSSAPDVASAAVEVTERAEAVRTPVAHAPVAAPAGSTHRIVARVVDAQGRPIPGAVLAVPETRIAAVGDERGDVTLVVPADVFNRVPRTVGANDVWVEARAPGCATRRLVRTTSTSDTTWLGDVRLEAGFRIAGRVEDEFGAPLAGARVVVRPARSLESDEGVAPFAADDADAWQLEDPSGFGFGPNPDPRIATPRRVACGVDGGFECSDLAAGTYTVDATAGDRPWSRRAPIRLGVGLSTDEFVFALAPATPEAFVHVHVVDARDRAVPHATLVVTRGGRRSAAQGTDDAGRLRMRAPTEPWSVTAIATASDLGPRTIDGLDASTRSVEIRLDAAERVDVRVIDAEGAPVRGGWVQATPLDSTRPSLTPWAELDAEGSARVVVPERPFRLYVEATGYDSVHTPAFPANETRPVVTLVRSEGSWSLRVTADGTPLVGARVTPLRAVDGWRTIPEVAWTGTGAPFTFASEVPFDEATRARMGSTTDTRGRVVRSDPSRGGTDGVRFLVESSRGSWCSDPVDPAAARAGTIELAFVPGGSIEGRVVVDGGARTAAGWWIHACSSTGFLARTAVDPEGAYALSGLPAGSWQVRAFAPDAVLAPPRVQVTSSAPRGDVELASGARVRHDLAVDTRAAPVLRGRIRIDGRTDRALWSASLGATGGSERTGAVAAQMPPVSVGPDGSFELALPKGVPCRVILTNPNHWELRDVVTAETGVVVREWEIATGEIRGTTSETARPEPAWIDYAWSGGGDLEVIVRELASTSNVHVPPTRVPCGSGRLVVRSLGAVDVLRHVDVPCGGVLDLSR